MTQMLTVACVLKSGGIYDATWVARLRDGVKRHLPMGHRFVCLSDVNVPCERIPLEHDWPGWWAKIELFKLEGPVLYFDLDTAIVGDISDLAEMVVLWRFKWWLILALRDFYRLDGIGSGVMGWRENIDFMYWEFWRQTETHMARNDGSGDQGYIEKVLNREWTGRLQDFLTDENGRNDQIVSYKVHCGNGIPPNARVVCLHGYPKFADMPANDPVRVAWEMAA